MRIQTFLLFILILTVGCKSKKVINDLAFDNLKGEVILVKNGNSTIFYNEKGFIIKAIKKEALTTIHNYTYVNNKLQNIEVRANNIIQKVVYYYDSTGILTSYESITGLEGDNDSSMIHLFSFIKFDDQGNQIIDSAGENSCIKDFYSNSKKDSTIDNVRKTITVYSEGNPIKEMTYREENNGIREIVSIVKYQYSFDAQGNWIQQKSFSNEKESNVVDRIIVYKGNDISQYEKDFNDVKAGILSSKKSNSNQTTNNVIVGGSINNNSTNILPEPQRQKQWVNCNKCHGTGVDKCYSCNGKGIKRCWYCAGTGIHERITCRECHGKGDKECYECRGTGNWGNCKKCSGRGQVQG